jgi:hypothetical protein
MTWACLARMPLTVFERIQKFLSTTLWKPRRPDCGCIVADHRRVRPAPRPAVPPRRTATSPPCPQAAAGFPQDCPQFAPDPA